MALSNENNNYVVSNQYQGTIQGISAGAAIQPDGLKSCLMRMGSLLDSLKSQDQRLANAIDQHQVNESEKALIERIGTVIDTNRKAALSMTVAA